MNTQNKVNELLWLGLLSLMKEQDFSDITVKDLAERAQVCRASFYKNFKTIEQVIDYGLNDIFSAFFLQAPIHSSNITDFITQICIKFYAHREIFMLLHQQGMKNKIISFFERGTLISLAQLELTLPKYHDYYFAGASAAVLLAWLEHSFEESPEEMAQTFVQALTAYPIISL